MRKSKPLVVFCLVFGLIVSAAVAAQASYKEEASKILKDIGKKMKGFAADKKAMNNGTKSLDELLKSAKKRKQDAFDKFKKVAELNAKAEDMKFQFILHSTAEKWYSATKKWYDALAVMEEKLQSLGRDMTLIAKNMQGIGEVAQKKKENDSS